MIRTPQACFLSFDIEDWFQSENLRPLVPRSLWDGQQFRVAESTERILSILENLDLKATFFILGWVAERIPSLVKHIQSAGHEVASHGYDHELIPRQSLQEFERDIVRSKRLLEDMTGQAVKGYRAPCFSVNDDAIDILRKHGFTYDSSLHPFAMHQRYGSLSLPSGQGPAPRRPFEVRPGFWEIPISVVRAGRLTIPWAGGGYFRMLPYCIFRLGLPNILREAPLVFYLHPWELDCGQPDVPGMSLATRLRHSGGTRTAELRLRRFLEEWGPKLTFMRMSDAVTDGRGIR